MSARVADALTQELIDLGVDPPFAAADVANYPHERIRRQLDHLPHRRGIRDPAAAIRAAIRDDWPPPRPPTAPAQARRPEPATMSSEEAEAIARRLWPEKFL